MLDGVMGLVERYEVRLVGRVWVKQTGTALKPDPTYTYAVQDIARHFNHFLAVQQTQGLVVCDAREPRQDVRVAHSLFTQKHKAGGDASTSGVHTHQRFDVLRGRYAKRLGPLQYQYRDTTGRMRGGIVVSDKLGQQSSDRLFV